MNKFSSILMTAKNWLSEHALVIFLILLATWVVSRFINKILEQIIQRVIPRGSFSSESEEQKREDTLIKITQNFFSIFIWIVAVFAILSQLGVPVAPLITGAGILGVAIGFGSQSLVKDIITGLFIIAENQFRIGDYVCVDKYCGTVEDMTLRVTKLRENDGTIHYVPNGEIKVASNKSKDFSRVNFTINIGYNSNLDKVELLINKIGKELAEDPEYADKIIDVPRFLRIDDFQDHALSVRVLAKVKPKQQYLINGEMRRRLRKIFDEPDIDIPYQTHIFKNFKK